MSRQLTVLAIVAAGLCLLAGVGVFRRVPSSHYRLG